MRRLLSVALFAGLMAPALPGVAAGQSAGAALHVRTADGRTTYYIGERIALALDFTGPDNRQFEINMASYDRSGRMSYELFDVQSKSRWADPLGAYYGSGKAFMGGGLTSSSALSPKATTIPLDLNEWVRLDRPGMYRIAVTSHRVVQVNAHARGPFGDRGLALRADPIELHIVTAPVTWQKAKLASSLAELRAEPPVKYGIASAKKTAAIADLRYLATPASIGVLAELLGPDEEQNLQFQAAFGLMGLPPRLRPFAIALLGKKIDAPDAPVTSWYFDVLPVMELSASSGIEAEADAQRVKERVEERERLAGEVWERVLEVLPDKQGKARAVTALTLLESPQYRKKPDGELGKALASSLAYLPLEDQLTAMQYHWEDLRSPDLLPTLEQIAKVPHDYVSKDPRYNNAGEMRASALRLWYQLDPAGARAEVLRQVGSEHPSLTADALDFLPKEKLPELENAWARALMATDDYTEEAHLLDLMARFGAGTEVGLVRERAEAKVGEWACAPQNAALGYLVEFDPATADSLMTRAIRERGPGKSACNHTTLEEVSRYATDPFMTKIAIDAMEDSDPEVTMGALDYLMYFGDASAKEPVWARYVEWSEEWKGREDVLEHREAGSIGNARDMEYGKSLAHVLLAGQGWMADRDLIAQVFERCVGEQVCGQIKYYLQGGEKEPYGVSATNFGPWIGLQIAQYQSKTLEMFEAKVKQYPRGTKFTMVEGPQGSRENAMTQQMRAMLEKNGMVLVEPVSPTTAAN